MARKTTAGSTQRRPPSAGFQVGDRVRAVFSAPPEYAGRVGTVTEVDSATSGNRVEFEDGRRPTTGYLTAAWLDRADGAP